MTDVGCLQGGVLVVGGNSKYEVPLQLHSIAMHQQSVLGVHRGTRSQLSELVYLVAANEVRHFSSQLCRCLLYVSAICGGKSCVCGYFCSCISLLICKIVQHTLTLLRVQR